MCDDQVTIFEVVPNENLPDFRTMTIEKIVEQVSLMTGLKFFCDSQYKETPVYKAKYSQKDGCELHLSKYAMEERKGEPFISCSIWHNNGWEGCAVGCDSIEQVVDLIRKNLLGGKKNDDSKGSG